MLLASLLLLVCWFNFLSTRLQVLVRKPGYEADAF